MFRVEPCCTSSQSPSVPPVWALLYLKSEPLDFHVFTDLRVEPCCTSSLSLWTSRHSQIWTFQSGALLYHQWRPRTSMYSQTSELRPSVLPVWAPGPPGIRRYENFRMEPCCTSSVDPGPPGIHRYEHFRVEPCCTSSLSPRTSRPSQTFSTQRSQCYPVYEYMFLSYI